MAKRLQLLTVVGFITSARNGDGGVTRRRTRLVVAHSFTHASVHTKYLNLQTLHLVRIRCFCDLVTVPVRCVRCAASTHVGE
jgi:hypothetical protein